MAKAWKREGQKDSRGPHTWGKGRSQLQWSFYPNICGGPLKCFFKGGHDKLCILEDSLCGRQENEKKQTQRQADLVRGFCRDLGESQCSLLGWQ